VEVYPLLQALAHAWICSAESINEMRKMRKRRREMGALKSLENDSDTIHLVLQDLLAHFTKRNLGNM
jgi:hypothetical protein